MQVMVVTMNAVNIGRSKTNKVKEGQLKMQVMYSNYNISGRVGPYSILFLGED